MIEKRDQQELQRRLEQARRVREQLFDPLSAERLAQLISDLEEQLK